MIVLGNDRRRRNRSNLRTEVVMRVWIIVVCMVLPFSSPVNAQTNSVSIESAEMQPSLVLGRPMLTWWNVKIQGPGLAVGQLKFDVKHDNEHLCSAETEELTLNGPEQRIRVILPSVDSLSTIDQLQVDVSYRGKTFTGLLGRHILRVPFATKKVFNCLLVESPGVRKNTIPRDRMMESLRFETLVLELGSGRKIDEDREQAKTIFPSVDPADLPSEAMAYCGYDMVAISSDAFRTLRKPQLEALFAWTKAGGSVYVEPGGILEPYHLDFLRNLVATDDSTSPFVVDSTGKLIPDDHERDAISSTCGIGYAVVRVSEPGKLIDIESAAWHKIARPLWKARQVALQDRVLNDPRQTIATFVEAKGRATTSTQSLSGQYRNSATSLLLRLMPEGVRMVPVWVLTLILAIYVALIGPGDYFILGSLRARKLTWLSFPITTLAVAGLTIWLSNGYMTASEARRAVVLKDLDKGGEVVRTNRLELLYIASSRPVPTKIEKGFFAPMTASTYKLNQGMPQNYDNFFDMTMRTEGRIPTEYSVTQNVAKWTPVINRVFSIPGDVSLPQVDWSEFDLESSQAEQISLHTVPLKLLEVTRKQFGPQAMVACFSGVNGWAYDRTAGWSSSRSDLPQTSGPYIPNRFNREVERVIPEINGCRDAGAPEFFTWIYAACVGFAGNSFSSYVPASNLYSVINQTAPKGGANCDDLPLLDTTDPRAWLLVVVVPDKNDLIVYRKLMQFTDAK